MNKEILMVVDAVSNEKGVDKEIIFEALEAALASATRKRHGEGIDVRVAINRKTGDYDTFRRWKVFADDSREMEVPQRELRLEDALDINKEAEVGGFVEEPMESVAFGRIAAQQAKQVIVQKVREAEREMVVNEYQSRVGTLVSGIVKRVDRNGVYVDLGGNAEGFVPRDQMIPREPVRSQDRIKAYLQDVRSEQRGPQLFLTRTAPEFLIELFKLEVPEVGQGLIQILGAARDPGVRAKIAPLYHSALSELFSGYYAPRFEAAAADPDSAESKQLMRIKSSAEHLADHFADVPLLLFAFAQHDPSGEYTYSVLRPDHPHTTQKGRVVKYMQPAGVGLRLDVPLRCVEGPSRMGNGLKSSRYRSSLYRSMIRVSSASS